MCLQSLTNTISLVHSKDWWTNAAPYTQTGFKRVKLLIRFTMCEGTGPANLSAKQKKLTFILCLLGRFPTLGSHAFHAETPRVYPTKNTGNKASGLLRITLQYIGYSFVTFLQSYVAMPTYTCSNSEHNKR